MSLNTGQLIYNRYRIVRLLGQGGFGAVYRAWDVSLNKPVALKRNLDTTRQAQQQFAREAKILGNLSHPNLPRVTDHFSTPDMGQFLVMDYIEGEDLEEIIQREGRVEPARALEWIDQVADALAYLHRQPSPVIHRDIKPANIRITADGRAYLVDFGLVKLYAKHKKTTVGARAVTPGFSPPEQYGQGNTDGRTDIYALAATLYVALTGEEPVESIQRIVVDELRLASDVNPAVPSMVGKAIGKAMALSPTRRFDSVEGFRGALKSDTVASSSAEKRISNHPPPQLETKVLSSTPLDSLPSTPLPAQSNKNVHPIFWILGAGALVTLIFIAIILPSNRRQAEEALREQAELLTNREATDQAIERATDTMISQLTSTVVAKQTQTMQVQLTTTRQAQLILTDDQVAANLTATSHAASTATSFAQATDTIRAQSAATREVRLTQTRQALNAEGTQQVQATATRAARSTMTREARLEQTRQAQAEIQATIDAADAYVTSIAPSPNDLITTVNGELTHDDDNFLEWYIVRHNNRALQRADFIIEMNFTNPYDASAYAWNHGVLFRLNDRVNEYRLFITSTRMWRLEYINYVDEQIVATTISEGRLPTTALVNADETNKFYLAAQGGQGIFYLNDEYISTLDLSRITESGSIAVGAGLLGESEVAGEKTLFTDMKVWLLNR